MKKIIYLSAISFLLLANSCKKSDISNSVSLNIEDTFYSKYLKISNAKDGGILISSNSRNFKKDISYDIRAGFNTSNYEDININNEVTLTPYVLNGVVTNQYRIPQGASTEKLSQLFGKKINISFNSSQVSLRNANNIYNPQSFNISGGSRNTSLSWNADNNNGKVYILISFVPQRAINESFSSYQSVERFIETDDDGFYQLTESNFSGVPLGGHVDILIARGNTAIIGGQTNGGGTSSIQAFSTVILSGGYGGGGGNDGPFLNIL